MDHLIERIYNFLLEYIDENGDLYYLNSIDEMIIEEKRSLYIDLQHLENFDPVVVDEILLSPQLGLKSATDALKQVLLGKEPEYLSRMQNRVYLRAINPPDRIKRTLRKIRSYALGTLISTEAIITKSTEVKPYLETATFRCVRCQALQPSIKFTEGEYNPPFACINATNQTEPCTNKTFSLMKDQSTFIDFQRVSLQEKPEEIPSGQMPESLTMFMRDDLCDLIRPGNRVKIVGILESRTEGQLTRGKMPLFNKYVECVSIEKESEEYTDIEINDEDEKEIIELSKDPNIHRKIRNSIAPVIYGALEEKEGISYLLFGGSTKIAKDGTKIRGESNILLIGDPGMGKSQILKSVSNLVPRGLYTSGRGSSAAGLTAAVLRDPETGEMVLEAGSVVLADKGIVFIDEFDKMRREDRSALHEMMEQHSVSIAKAGIVATLNARTSILAAANPKLGRWDNKKDTIDNLNLPPTIISRFDLIFPLIDSPNRAEDELKASYILKIHQRNDEIGQIDEGLPKNLLRKYIAYARKNIQPILSSGARDEILKFYLELREGKGLGKEIAEFNLDDESTSQSTKEIKTIAITPRQLESLIRLSEARAKVALRTEVSREDAIRVIELFKQTLLRVTKGDIDSLYGMSSQKRNTREIILKIIGDLSQGDQAPDIDDILRQGREAQLEVSDIRDMVDKLLQNGDIYEPRPGQFKRMD